MIFSFFKVLPMTDTPIRHFISFNDFIINPNMLQDLISVFLRCKKSDVLWIHAKHHDHLVLDDSSIRNGCRQFWELVKVFEPLCYLFLQFFCELLDRLGFAILPLLFKQKNLLFDIVSLFIPIYVFYSFFISIFSELSTSLLTFGFGLFFILKVSLFCWLQNNRVWVVRYYKIQKGYLVCEEFILSVFDDWVLDFNHSRFNL